MIVRRFRKILVAWSLINVPLAAYLLFSFFARVEDLFPSFFAPTDSDLFFQFVCASSIFLFLVLLLLRHRIERTLLLMRDTLRKVDSAVPEDYRFPCSPDALGWFLIAIVAVFGFYMVFLSFTDVNAYSKLIWEDGLVERGSFVVWCIAALMTSASFLCGKRSRISVYVYLALVLFFIICAGEEMSWGQQLFRFETPEILRAINKQNETTLHNIGSISIFSNGFFLLTLIFFLLVPFSVRRHRSLQKYIGYSGLPMSELTTSYVYLVSLGVWVVIGVRFGTLGFHPFSAWGYYGQLDDEVFELLAAYSFFAFALLDFRFKLRRRPGQ